jgi:alpha-ketoglutarate-dependent taurine dioxygenase
MVTVNTNLPIYIECNDPAEFSSNTKMIEKTIAKYGVCVINAWDAEVSTLKLVASIFGDIQGHARANEEGIVGEGNAIDSSWKDNKDEYQGVTAEEFLPHTDGSFLDGYTINDNRLVHVGPPKFILLQCVNQADEGGQNYIIDAERILGDLIENDPEVVQTLLKPGCITFFRDDLYAIDQPVYRKRLDGSYQLRFRYDFATYSPVWAVDAVKHLHKNYHMNNKYRINITLKSRQILVVDNLRLLHAREAFKSNSAQSNVRKLRRIWIYDENKPMLQNVTDNITQHRALIPFIKYKIVQKNELSNSLGSFNPGIRMSYSHVKQLESMLQQKLHQSRYFLNTNKYNFFASNSSSNNSNPFTTNITNVLKK